MPQLCCEIIFLAASEGLVAFPSVPFPQSLFPGDTKSQLEKGSPDKGQGIVPGMYKYLSVVTISILSLSFLWRRMLGFSFTSCTVLE